MNEAEQFFFDNAGYSYRYRYRPAQESEFVGRVLCAVALARAEAWARDVGAVFEWRVDEPDSSEWNDERPAWAQYCCVMYLPCAECAPFVYGHESSIASDCPRKLHTHLAASLGGIDLGRNGSPYEDPYASVVEAELALEAMPE